MKILILGYSNIVRKRILSVFKQKKIKIFVASKTYKKKIPGIEKQFTSYEQALIKCKPNIVYISLPNLKHFEWAKKSLNLKYNTIIDKPITSNYKQLDELIKLSKKNKRLLVESTFFNYHIQMKKIVKMYKKDKYKKINATFVIPKPNKKSILMSKKLQGGVLMDMGPYISSIPRLFNLKKLIKKRIKIKTNKDKLIMSISFFMIFKEGDYKGLFKFGGKYKNQITITNKSTESSIKRVFSPPHDENLILKSISKKKEKITKLKKDNSFKNFFLEVLKIIKEKRFDFYFKRMRHDSAFRNNFNKKKLFK